MHGSFRLVRVGYPEIEEQLLFTSNPVTVSSKQNHRFQSGAACYSTDTFTVVIIRLTMMTVKILQLPVKTHK